MLTDWLTNGHTLVVVVVKFISRLKWVYSGFKAKMCTTFLALVWLRSLSACSNAYDSHLGSHTHDVLSIGVTEINVYGHRSQENTIFCFLKKVWYSIVFSGVLWPYTLVSVALIGNTSWLCDPKWESYALEQSERLVSHARATKVVHNFAWNPLCNKVLHSFALNPLYNKQKSTI